MEEEWAITLEIALLCFVVYLFGRLCKIIHVSHIVGEIAAGLILGPRVLNMVPYVLVDEDSIYSLAGQLGIILFIAESGLHITSIKLSAGLNDVLIVALLSMIFTFCLGFVLIVALDYSPYPDALFASIALSTTSVSISLSILSSNKLSESKFGESIIIAAIIDNIILLLVYEYISHSHFVDSSDSNYIWLYIYPVLFSLLFLFISVYLSFKVFPILIPWILDKMPQSISKLQPRDELHLFMMLFLLLGYSIITWLFGALLIGPFFAGLSFFMIRRSSFVWERQMKRINKWLLRFFFSTVIGFWIPINAMFHIKAFWQGVVIALGPGILTKLLSTFYLEENRILCGVLMIPRGEFAFFIAHAAYIAKLIGEELYSTIVWAFIFTILLAPHLFRFLLSKDSNTVSPGNIVGFKLTVQGHHHLGVLNEVAHSLHAHDCDVIECHTETDGIVDLEIFTIKTPENIVIDANKIHQIHEAIIGAIDDPEAQCLLSAIYEEIVNDDNPHFLELKIMSGHEEVLLEELLSKITSLNLEISKAQIEEHDHTDVHVFFAKDLLMEYGDHSPDALNKRRHFIRTSLLDLFRRYDVKGEVMLRFVPQSATQSLDNDEARHIDADYQVKLRGSTSVNSLSEMVKAYSEMNLDVKAAFVDHDMQGDSVDVFFLKKRRNSRNLSRSASETALYQDIPAPIEMEPIKKLDIIVDDSDSVDDMSSDIYDKLSSVLDQEKLDIEVSTMYRDASKSTAQHFVTTPHAFFGSSEMAKSYSVPNFFHSNNNHNKI